MIKPLSDLDRLNLAAKAVIAEHRYEDIDLEDRIPVWRLLLFFAWVLILEGSTESATWWLRGTGVLILVTGIAVQILYRSAIMLWTICFCLFQVVAVLLSPSFDRYYGARMLLNLFLGILLVFSILKDSELLSSANQEVLSAERDLVRRWYNEIKDSFGTSQTVEFKVGNFWRGFTSYRLLDTGNCWAIATANTKDKFWAATDLQIVRPQDIRACRTKSGRLQIVIGKRTLTPCKLDNAEEKSLLQVIQGDRSQLTSSTISF